jgi:CRP-like cAMP-binding protein
MATADDLRGVPLFSGLNKRQLSQLAKDFKERRVKSVRVDAHEVARLGPGDSFGELALVTEHVRSASVVALTDMRCHTIQFWHFRKFARNNPDVTWNMLQHVSNLLLEERGLRARAAIAAS